MNLKIEEESILDQDEGSNHLAQAYRHLKYQAAPRQAEILGGPLPPGTSTYHGGIPNVSTVS